MGIFKSEAEKIEEQWKKVKDNWDKYSESKLGLSFEEARQVHKEFEKALIDAVNDQGLITDWNVINTLFPDFSPKQKALILHYGRWAEELKTLEK